MCEKYDVTVTKKRFLKSSVTLKGKILKETIEEYEDWLGSEYREQHTVIKLENGKIIKITQGITILFERYSFERLVDTL